MGLPVVRDLFFHKTNCTFDKIEHAFEGLKGQRFIGSLLVVVFLVGLLGIQINIWGLMPPQLVAVTPTNHLEAIALVFTVLLVFEAIGLLFSLVYSVSISVGKQVEILSLVLLRNIFKAISTMDEPLLWDDIVHISPDIAALAIGALLIFVILSFYNRQHEQSELSIYEQDTQTFVIVKKMIAMVLMVAFAIIFGINWYQSLFLGISSKTFESFFTLLVFSDILIMLIAMRYGSCYRVAFRNSGYAVGTILIRIALISPPLYSAMIGVCSALLVLSVRIAYNKYTPSTYQKRREDLRRQKCR